MKYSIGSIACLLLLGMTAGCSAPGADASPSPAASSRAAVFAGTRTEYQRAVYGCLEAKGWPVTETTSPDGYLSVLVDGLNDPDRMAAFQGDNQACTDALPPIPEPQTDDDVRAMYDHAVQRLACLSAAGLTDAQAPSFQAYLDDFRAGTLDWDPIGAVAQAQYASAQKTCPIDADAWW